MERVNFFKRLVAYLTDVGIMVMVLTILTVALDLRPEVIKERAGETEIMLKMLAPTVFFFLYSLMEVIPAQSPGKMIMGMIIRQENGMPAEKSSLVLRWALKNGGALLGLVAGLFGQTLINDLAGLLFIAFLLGCFLALRAKRQTLHDIIAKTAVYPVKAGKKTKNPGIAENKTG